MKKFLTLTLVLFLSLFIVGESGASHEKPLTTDEINEIWLNGEVMGVVRNGSTSATIPFLMIRYSGAIYRCHNEVNSWDRAETGHTCRKSHAQQYK